MTQNKYSKGEEMIRKDFDGIRCELFSDDPILKRY